MPHAVNDQLSAGYRNTDDAEGSRVGCADHDGILGRRSNLGDGVRDDPAFEPKGEAGTLAIAACGDPTSAAPNFLEWVTFDEATLPPRANPRRSRLDRIFSPLRSVRAGLPGNIDVEVGGVVESAHNLFHSARRLDFMESKRALYLYRKPGALPPSELPRRELERFENELFDLSKYDGACDYLSALTWTEESLSGSVTLYEVLFGDQGETIGIRPVAAMRDIPSSVLVKMRTDDRIRRKAVFAEDKADDRSFNWTANPSRGPRYMRLAQGKRVLSPLRSPSRNRTTQSSPRLADADAISATIPQFIALLHARRAVVEHVKSSRLTFMQTEDSKTKPTVFLTQPPRSSPHDGDGVHVAVLIPDDAPWAEEEIVWTDHTGLSELRQRQYWQLISRASPRGRGRSRSRNRTASKESHAGSRQRSRSRA
ncbi:hypothetical protein VTI74DRAFT_5829 [Chaetomium olivicolor]